jgi:hypothetical protein
MPRHAMHARERRNPPPSDSTDSRASLTAAQAAALQTLEQFQWSLKFVRRPAFLDPVPVVVDRHGQRHAVLEPDGSLNESHGLRIRD